MTVLFSLEVYLTVLFSLEVYLTVLFPGSLFDGAFFLEVCLTVLFPGGLFDDAFPWWFIWRCFFPGGLFDGDFSWWVSWNTLITLHVKWLPCLTINWYLSPFPFIWLSENHGNNFSDSYCKDDITLSIQLPESYIVVARKILVTYHKE